MEVIINAYSANIPETIHYYVDELAIFDLASKTDYSALLKFRSNIDLTLFFSQKNDTLKFEISLQVANSEKLFQRLAKLRLFNRGILQNAYKFDSQQLTFLTAPPGNYFYTTDPMGNKIQFFDKYDERIV